VPETSPTAAPRAAPAARTTRAVRPPEAAQAAPAPGETAAPPPTEAAPAGLESLPSTLPDTASTPEEDAGGGAWLWALAGLLGLGAALGAAAWLWRRRESAPVAVPQIERPRL